MTKTLLLTGSFTGDSDDGVNLIEFDDATGSLSLVRELRGAPDASFLSLDPVNRRLFAVDEAHGRVGSFNIKPGIASIEEIGYQPSQGTYVCYVKLSPDRTRVAAANYGNDVALIYALDGNGRLQSNPKVLKGTSSEPGHAHQIQWSPEGDRLYVVDLGHDEVRTYTYNAATGDVGVTQTAFKTPAKHGPRHLAFHPDRKRAYLLTEHGNTLVALSRQADGTLKEINTVPSLPDDYKEKAQAAHIQISPDGAFVYVSNRGPQTIGVFRIAADGSVSAVQQVATGGEWPRFFLLLGRHLLCCNQNTDNIVVFDVAADGTLKPNGKSLKLKAPVCLVPIEA